MTRMKLLLYCTKSKPYLYKTDDTMIEKMDGDYHIQLNKAVLNDNCLNGKIVAECDYDISIHNWYNDYNLFEKLYYQENMMFNNENSCMSSRELVSYLGNNNLKKDFYAIHIKNLHIFDEPKDLNEYYTRINDKDRMNDCKGIDVISPTVRINKFFGEGASCKKLKKAPQNMQKIILYNKETNEYEYAILISIKPEYLCKILNREKTIEIRKKVLKEML